MAQVNQAFRLADIFAVGKSPYETPTYPYIFMPTPKHNTIRMEMGKNAEGRRIVALFTIKAAENKPGALIHVAVFLIDETRAAQQGVDPEFASTVVTDLHYHTEAYKHFRGQLLRLDLGISNGYIVTAPSVPPPPEANLPPPPDFEDLL